MPLETWGSIGAISVFLDEMIPQTRSFTKKRDVFPGLLTMSLDSREEKKC